MSNWAENLLTGWRVLSVFLLMLMRTTREHLTDTEVAKLTKAGKRNRYGHRDENLIRA